MLCLCPLFRTLFLAAVAVCSARMQMASAAECTVNGRRFVLAEGFDLSLAADTRLAPRPIAVDFDQEGNLYVTDSSGTNDPVEKQLADKPHRILRLQDSDGDGVFDKQTVFADQMMLPQGAAWLNGSLYVAAPPSIWKLTDTDGDGVADRREEWCKGQTLTGCANDLHGPYVGPDGWLYWCKGGFAKQTYLLNGKPWTTRAAHLFRARPDGSRLEPILTGGMDNPVEVAFTSDGERFVSATFVEHPGGGLRDGLVHAIYNGVFGKVHDVLDGQVRTSSNTLPVMTHLGPAAPCGLLCYQNDAFGDEYTGNLFCTLFNMHKVTRHVLQPKGVSFTTKDEDFLVADDRDFHPTDVIEDADGSLLVVDTGGWYKLCCPTSQLHKPEATGAIYRIRRAGIKTPADPRGLQIAWDRLSNEALAKLFDDPRPAVRMRAIALPSGDPKKYAEFFEGIDRAHSVSRRTLLSAAWAAARMPKGYVPCFKGARGGDDLAVSRARVRAWAAANDLPANFPLAAASATDSPALLTVAVEAGIANGGLDLQGLQVIYQGLHSESDPFAEHALTLWAIRGQLPDDREFSAATARACLIAEDQTHSLNSKRDRAKILGYAAQLFQDEPPRWTGKRRHLTVAQSAEANASYREAIRWVLSQHPEWGEVLADWLIQNLDNVQTLEKGRALSSLLAQFAGTEQVRNALADRLLNQGIPLNQRVVSLQAMRDAQLRQTPPRWAEAAAKALEDNDLEVRTLAIDVAKRLTQADDASAASRAPLLKFAENATQPSGLRLRAMTALPKATEPTAGALRWLLEQFVADNETSRSAQRAMVIEALSRLTLSSEQLEGVIPLVERAAPLEIDGLLTLFEQSTDEALGRRLTKALSASPAAPSLRGAELAARLANFGPEVRAGLQQLSSEQAVDAEARGARLKKLLDELPGGDVRRGQAIFNAAKTSCSACHAIGYLGGAIGPDLTRIGQVRVRRDLLESILYPSASFVRSFEPMVAETKDGRVFTGLLSGGSELEVVLVEAPQKVRRLQRAEIQELRPGEVSVMPAGLDKQLSNDELADLLAFLQACK